MPESGLERIRALTAQLKAAAEGAKERQEAHEAYLAEHPEETFEFQLREVLTRHHLDLTDEEFEEVKDAVYKATEQIFKRRITPKKRSWLDSFGSDL